MYYTFSYPGSEQEVGRWGFNDTLGVYVGPVFLVSRQDIHYAQMLPCKITAALSSCRPLVQPDVYRRCEKKIMGAMSIQSNSTWATSYRTGANRFITCCHISASGDIPALIEGQLGHLKYHRFADYMVMKYMLRYIDDRPSTEVSPLFRLPLPLISYEKDFSQTLQWHMRDTNHSTNCMIKVTDAAKRHKGEEIATNTWLNAQYDFLIEMMQEGKTYEDYKKIMHATPSFPTLNIISFIGMCSIIKDDIKDLGSIQHALGFSIWSMMTDRHCIEYKGTTTSGIPQLVTSKVVESMSNYLRGIGGVTGGYELIAKMSLGHKLPPNYLLNHYKDAKEAEREISQMYPQHRIKQCFPEVLTETFTGNNDADQMSEPLKYNKHVQDTMDPALRGKGMHSSEDRSKFCQEQEPQLQGLAIAIVSYEAGSTALRSAAAMTLMNKKRVVVYPHEADHEMLLDDLDTKTAVIVSAKKKHFTKTLEIEKNMTQGLGAVTAGAVNTIYVTAQDKIITKLIDGLESKCARTTSDDVKRSALYDGPFNKQSVSSNYYHFPNHDLHMAMMVENKKKPITSEFISEFNNVVATYTGMIPQSPVFATLCVQPLLSKSLLGDIVSVVNSSRSTLSWGCPPDTLEASLHAMIRVLRQKWLLSDDEVDILWQCGFFPRKIAHHISGFWVRDDTTIRNLYGAFTDEQKKDVLTGDVALYDMLKRAELDTGSRSKKKRQQHKPIGGLIRANKVADVIMRQRYVAERLMSRHIQPIPPGVRSATKKRFFDLISQSSPDVDITALNALKPPRVTIHTRAARRKDRLPTSIGTSSEVMHASLQRIRAARYLNVHYRDFLTAREEEIVAMEQDDYDKAIAVLEKAKHYEGLSFKSPVGLPICRMFDNTIYTRPASFNFTVEVEQSNQVEQPFTWNGIIVTAFRPILYGSNSLYKIQRGKNTRLAFGHGILKGKQVIFFKDKTRGAEVRAVPVERLHKQLTIRNFEGRVIYYMSGLDPSPLLYIHHKNDSKPNLPGLIGDNEAILNYGMYCRSSQPAGFTIYRKVFESYNSELPHYVSKHMPSYPFFPYGARSTTIRRGRITALIDYLSIPKLILTSEEDCPHLVSIQLGGDVPTEVIRAQNEGEVLDW
jgi:hypothetical protein